MRCFGFHDWQVYQTYKHPVTHPNPWVEKLRRALLLIAGISALVTAFMLLFAFAFGPAAPTLSSVLYPFAIVIVSGIALCSTFSGDIIDDASCIRCRKHKYDFSKRELRLADLEILKQERENLKQELKVDFEEQRLETLAIYLRK